MTESAGPVVIIRSNFWIDKRVNRVMLQYFRHATYVCIYFSALACFSDGKHSCTSHWEKTKKTILKLPGILAAAAGSIGTQKTLL